ncbi:alpha/beta hydrolase-fold protein [Apibacter raozihei]|uniref:alpha/beta hydrolase n=1 Tax=Apibacter raozihei TaxID=2500547 RepID=UPI000FE4066C|nr:alpha/beta hydrolase-fold protein [Apibacter raozihei]
MVHYLLREPKSATETPSLILLLHGYGSNEQDLFSFAEELPDDAYVISLRAVRETPMGGFSWYDLDFSGGARMTDVQQAVESQEIIIQFITQVHEKFPFDKNSITLLGFSQGAILSFSLALHHPQTFKKVLCLSGYPDPELLKDIDMGTDFSQLEFFISHGKEDPVIPIQWARQFKPICEELDLDFEYHEYEQGHGINAENYYDLLNFLQ